MKGLRILLAACLSAVLFAAAAVSACAFGDVPENHWSYSYVNRAAEAGAVNGVGGGLFDPDSSVTEAQFYAMLLRTLSDADLGAYVPGANWYDVYMAAAADTGLSEGVYAPYPDAPLTRCQMAQIMFNLIRGPRDEANAEKVLAAIPDGASIPDAYRFAVAFAYSAGLIRGMDDAGAFMGDLPMTRAQAAAVWCRLADYLEEFGVNDEIPGEGKPVDDQPESNEGILNVNGVDYRVGMSRSELTALAGDPDEILASFGGYRWYVFGTADYENKFFAAGVLEAEDRVVLLCSVGKSFSASYLGEAKSWGSVWGGLPHGAQAERVTAEGSYADTVFRLDKYDNYTLYAVFMAEKQYLFVRYYTPGFSVTDEMCRAESRLLFHLTNAYRAAHGARILLWDSAAEKAARLHAEDMTARDYFSHTGADGSSLGERLTAAGAASWSFCGENIAGGYWGAFDAFTGWVASEGHRSNMLSGSPARFGAGISVDGRTTNYVEDFYSEMGE